MSRSRAFLAKLLWSDRARPQALGSLRQSLIEIRQALGPFSEILHVSRTRIWLDANLVQTDLTSPPPHKELLEDLLIRDEAFNSWLRRTRELYSPTRTAAPNYLVAVRIPDDGLHNDLLGSGIAESITDWCAARVATSNVQIDEEDSARYLLDNLTAASEDKFISRLRLREGNPRETIWSTNAALPIDPVELVEQYGVHKLINQAVDRTIFELAPPHRSSDEGKALQLGALGAVQLIFRNGPGDLEAARAQLDRNYEQCNRGIYLAWNAYILTFLKAERNAPDLDALRKRSTGPRCPGA